ncbi:MAG: dienelactone hydrolase family protein [Telmatospirillum sp.]|nr:dienelactone hydrolase family protein [Telmatospirillum sp.]
MGRTISLAEGLSAYVAEPAEPAAASVVVIQEIFGVNTHIRSVADGYAAEGYLAIAPALFDRVEPGVEFDYSAASVAKGVALAGRVGFDQALSDVGRAIDWAEAQTPGHVGVVGFCLGGSLAWLAAARLRPRAAVAYYGGQIPQFRDEAPLAPILLHFGEKDGYIPLEAARDVERLYPDIPVHFYPAEHGFNCDARASYHRDSALLARSRTLDFLREHLLS